VLAILIISTVCESVGPFSGPETSLESIALCSPNSVKLLLNDAIKKDLQYVNKSAVGQYSSKYGIDFRLIMAMIKQESRFDQDAVSERGAQGLMQIMPVTNSEIADEIDIQDPSLPHENLRAGVYYVAKLSELFKDVKGEDRTRLVLAAYNAGPSRIYDAQELAAYLGEDPHSWSSIRNMLPLLSKRYYSLHHSVWGTNRPPNGYYGSANQTIQYVDNIMKTYLSYCKPA
jgi:membrane-bound lytic murein transglycosylase F